MLKKAFFFSLLILFGCAAAKPGEVATGAPLFTKQWTSPTDMGGGKFYTKSFELETATKGANIFCSKQDKKSEVISVLPQNLDTTFSIIFICK